MSSSPDSSLHSTTNPDANVHTKHASAFLPPNSSLPTISGDISGYGAVHRYPSDNDMRPRNAPTAAEATAITALQIAEERHAREVQALKEEHTQDLEALREETKHVHDIETIEVKMALYAEHKRDLSELKEERERACEHSKAFFLATRAREKSPARFPTPSPVAAAPRELHPTCAAAPVEATSVPSGPASTSTASSTATTSPEIPTSSTTTTTTTTAPTSPPMPPSPDARRGSAVAAAPHVHFLTTGITPTEAKEATGEGGRREGDQGGAVKVVVGAGEGDDGGKREREEWVPPL
ncbi:hypothetical protein HO133_010773 [Letharia lupina]|uniref:Uncharacterized protein n=1 Tax=Letharia lupina TaxID=560253 RepID=A0A8H6CIP0_9LECA|nr:uncharacterized protein HO133_010773 [Letharia lupina]KAF6224198.1 hypothetical protein HO133_010773 [Letharia lupina]